MTTLNTETNQEQTNEIVTEIAQPVIVDLGRRRARKVRDLKDGEGELWDDVLDVIDDVTELLGEEANGKVLVPIVMVVEKRTSRRRLERVLFPLADWDDEDDDEDDDDDDD